MTTAHDAVIDADDAKAAGRKGEHWANHHAEVLAKLAPGTTVIINVETGEFVTGPTWSSTLEQFEARFGKDNAIGWSFEIGRPLFVGGGLWQS